MLESKKIAVTGSIGCGKSTFCRFLEQQGAYYVSADAIVHHILDSDLAVQQSMIALLGNDIAIENRIDRKKVAHKVFRNSHLLQQLETLLHPKVKKVIEAAFLDAKKKHIPLFVAEVPLLFEIGMEHAFDVTVLVTAPEEECLKRYQGTEEDFRLRMKRHWPQEKKSQLADWIIDNRADISELKKQSETFIRSLH